MLRAFLIRAVLFIAFGALIAAGLIHVAETCSPRYPKEKFRIGQLLARAGEIQALAVGNSHLHSLDFAAMDLPGYCVPPFGGDVFEYDYFLHALLPRLPAVRTVIMNLSYFSFAYDNEALPADHAYFTTRQFEAFAAEFPLAMTVIKPVVCPGYVYVNLKTLGLDQKNKMGEACHRLEQAARDLLEQRKAYYTAIPGLAWVRGDAVTYFKSRLSIIARPDHGQGVFRSLRAGVGARSGMAAGETLDIDATGQGTDEYYYAARDRAYLENYTRDFGVPFHRYLQVEMTRHHPGLEADTLATLQRTVAWLRQQHLRVVVYTPPYFYLYSELYDKETIRRMRLNLKKLEEEFGAEVYDFSEDSDFVRSPELFFDDTHLNKEGGRRFSMRLADAMRRRAGDSDRSARVVHEP